MDKEAYFISDDLKKLLNIIGFELFSYNWETETVYFKNLEYDILIKKNNSVIEYNFYLKNDYKKYLNSTNEYLFKAFLKEQFKGDIRRNKIKKIVSG